MKENLEDTPPMGPKGLRATGSVNLPNFHNSIIAATCQPVSIWSESNRVDFSSMSLQLSYRMFNDQISQGNLVIGGTS
jgi:hypothetical protein